MSESPNAENDFNLDNYFKLMEENIRVIMTRSKNTTATYDILDTEKSFQNKLVVLKEKQRQMNVGEIWQSAIGNYNHCVDLKNGHKTGLDILSHTRKFVIELKNRTNTDNASSKKSNLSKLAKFKKDNIEYTCIYANINDDTAEKTLSGYIKKIKHDDVEIEHHVGHKFLQFIFGDDMEKIIEFIKITIDKYL